MPKRNRHFEIGFSEFGEDGNGQDVRMFSDIVGKYVSWNRTTAALTIPGTINLANAQALIALDIESTAGVTVTTAPAGSIGITSHATGVGHLFMSDGTHWQYALVA